MFLKRKFDIKIDFEKCKGCGLCVEFCAKNALEISNKSNEKGLFPAQPKKNYKCSGCGDCATICPEGICFQKTKPLENYL